METFFEKEMSELPQKPCFFEKKHILILLSFAFFYTFVLLAMKFNQSGVVKEKITQKQK